MCFCHQGVKSRRGEKGDPGFRGAQVIFLSICPVCGWFTDRISESVNQLVLFVQGPRGPPGKPGSKGHVGPMGLEGLGGHAGLPGLPGPAVSVKNKYIFKETCSLMMLKLLSYQILFHIFIQCCRALMASWESQGSREKMAPR